MIGVCKVDDNCHCANAQHSITTKPMLYRTAEVKQDYLVFRKSLETIYPGLYRNTDSQIILPGILMRL
jgi:hypothetical protein